MTCVHHLDLFVLPHFTDFCCGYQIVLTASDSTAPIVLVIGLASYYSICMYAHVYRHHALLNYAGQTVLDINFGCYSSRF